MFISMFCFHILPILFFREFFETCETNSDHTVSCGKCMDAGMLNTIIRSCNSKELVVAGDALQRFVGAIQAVYNSNEPICGGFSVGECLLLAFEFFI